MPSTDTLQKTPRELAADLRAALKEAFSAMDCRKAIAICDNDLAKAADWLADGHWRSFKLISWNHESLSAKATALQQETGRAYDVCRETVMNCCGSPELARRKLQGLPALA